MRFKTNLLYIFILFCFFFSGCSDDDLPAPSATHDSSSPSSSSSSSGPSAPSTSSAPSDSPAQFRDNTPHVLVPSADGSTVYENDYATIDASNVSQGYVMVKYTGTCEKVKVQVIGSDQVTYTYLLIDRGSFTTFPLSAGNGGYTVRVLENVGGDSYAISLSQDFNVSIADDFLPFLYPNQYVNFTEDSAAVKKASDLAANALTDLDVVSEVYHYVTKNISYDTKKAENVDYGYLPNIDETMASGKGICFDYASLMASMLRSQNIPTRLQVGYSGEAYHAWISTYVDDIGWIDQIIEFDGKSWKLMDPTLAASNNSKSVAKYTGDGSNYLLKYSY